MSQFHYPDNDIVSLAGQKPTVCAVAALLVVLEKEHPGSLEWILRQCALVDANFRMTSTAREANHSVDAQYATMDWLKEFDSIGGQMSPDDINWEV